MASIGDVAKLAGVSRSTVSLVCNNKGYVSDETRKKIEKAMKELNYIPSELGRNLKMQNQELYELLFQISHIPFSVRLLNTQRKNCIPEGIRHWFVEQLGVKM